MGYCFPGSKTGNSSFYFLHTGIELQADGVVSCISIFLLPRRTLLEAEHMVDKQF